MIFVHFAFFLVLLHIDALEFIEKELLQQHTYATLRTHTHTQLALLINCLRFRTCYSSSSPSFTQTPSGVCVCRLKSKTISISTANHIIHIAACVSVCVHKNWVEIIKTYS